MTWINSTSTIQLVIDGITNNVTGELTGTYLFILMLLFLGGIIFRMPLFLNVLITFPMIIILAAYMQSFVVVLIVAVIYISGVIARLFWLN